MDAITATGSSNKKYFIIGGIAITIVIVAIIIAKSKKKLTSSASGVIKNPGNTASAVKGGVAGSAIGAAATAVVKSGQQISNIANGASVASSTNNLESGWTDGAATTYNITQDASGYGTINSPTDSSSFSLSGGTVSWRSKGITGTVSSDGNTISWSDGSTWTRTFPNATAATTADPVTQQLINATMLGGSDAQFSTQFKGLDVPTASQFTFNAVIAGNRVPKNQAGAWDLYQYPSIDQAVAQSTNSPADPSFLPGSGRVYAASGSFSASGASRKATPNLNGAWYDSKYNLINVSNNVANGKKITQPTPSSVVLGAIKGSSALQGAVSLGGDTITWYGTKERWTRVEDSTKPTPALIALFRNFISGKDTSAKTKATLLAVKMIDAKGKPNTHAHYHTEAKSADGCSSIEKEYGVNPTKF